MVVEVGGGDEGVGLQDEVDGFGLALGFLDGCLRASPEKMLPLTAMIFWPGASLALSAGPSQRTSEMMPSPVTRMPMEYQTLMAAAAAAAAEAMVRSEWLGLSVKTSL